MMEGSRVVYFVGGRRKRGGGGRAVKPIIHQYSLNALFPNIDFILIALLLKLSCVCFF